MRPCTLRPAMWDGDAPSQDLYLAAAVCKKLCPHLAQCAELLRLQGGRSEHVMAGVVPPPRNRAA